MPDKANLYLAAIEDEYYKDEKIHCLYFFISLQFISFIGLIF